MIRNGRSDWLKKARWRSDGAKIRMTTSTMRTLIIPDIHNQTENADHWLQTQKYDRIVFLGDFFDNYEDSACEAAKTALWLRERMEARDDVFLLGNHDAAYLFPDALECLGFTRAKSRAIHEVLKPRHWQRFQLAHFEQGWLLSHAGFHPVWIKEPSVKNILSRCGKAMRLAKKRIVDPILGAGEDRGGLQRFGGPLWMDFDNFLPIPKINQIVGHTPDEAVREKITSNSRNYCLDVKNASVAAILCGGKITILNREQS